MESEDANFSDSDIGFALTEVALISAVYAEEIKSNHQCFNTFCGSGSEFGNCQYNANDFKDFQSDLQNKYETNLKRKILEILPPKYQIENEDDFVNNKGDYQLNIDIQRPNCGKLAKILMNLQSLKEVFNQQKQISPGPILKWIFVNSIRDDFEKQKLFKKFFPKDRNVKLYSSYFGNREHDLPVPDFVNSLYVENTADNTIFRDFKWTPGLLEMMR